MSWNTFWEGLSKDLKKLFKFFVGSLLVAVIITVLLYITPCFEGEIRDTLIFIIEALYLISALSLLFFLMKIGSDK